MAEYHSFKERPLHHKLSGITFILFLILGGFTLWSAFIKETKKVNIKVEKGGQADIDLREERKKIFIPFLEAYIDQRSNSDLASGIRAGLRIEF